MYQTFYKLDKEKQDRIINSALYVFSINDFKHSSTDDIAAKAKISKGSLFQYFKNKRLLYIFLYEYTMKVLRKKVDEEFNFNETDYFQVLQQSQKLKISLLERYPYIYKFIIQASLEDDPEIVKLIGEINQRNNAEMYNKIYRGIDYSKFKEGTDIEKLTKMINWCSEGIWNDVVNNHLSISEMYEQALEVYDFYKNAVYKEEYLTTQNSNKG